MVPIGCRRAANWCHLGAFWLHLAPFGLSLAPLGGLRGMRPTLYLPAESWTHSKSGAKVVFCAPFGSIWAPFGSVILPPGNNLERWASRAEKKDDSAFLLQFFVPRSLTKQNYASLLGGISGTHYLAHIAHQCVILPLRRANATGTS